MFDFENNNDNEILGSIKMDELKKQDNEEWEEYNSYVKLGKAAVKTVKDTTIFIATEKAFNKAWDNREKIRQEAVKVTKGAGHVSMEGLKHLGNGLQNRQDDGL